MEGLGYDENSVNVQGLQWDTTVDGQDPALPIIRNIP